MGFSHHWYRRPVLNATKFIAAVVECERAKLHWHQEAPSQRLTNAPIIHMHLVDAVFNQNVVGFSGGCERFEIEREFSMRHRPPKEDGTYFSFCKTNQLPYDTLVTACLLIFKHTFGKGFKVSSNGTIEDWKAGIALVEKVVAWRSEWRFDEKVVDGISDMSLEETRKKKEKAHA